MGNDVYVFVDIETNGGNGANGRVIEVAAIKVHQNEIIETFTSLVNPGSPVPYWITKLTGIENSELIHAPYFSDIADELYRFMEGSIFVAHNVLFDYSFLKREFSEQGYKFSPKLFCTVKMSRALYPEHRGHSLEKIISRHNIRTKNRHRAYDDALAMYEFSRIAIAEKGEVAFEANRALQLKTRTLPPNVDEEIIQGLPETSGVYIFEDDMGAPLYVGKSVNIRARVKSHFTNATSIAKELKMSLHSHNVSFIQTETEIEALLLESAKVKELQPLFNRKLRRKRSQHIIVKHYTDAGYITFSIESHDLSEYHHLENVYGVFTSKSHAKAQLESIGKTYQLCPKLLGLEKGDGTCFRYQLGLCKGACGGLELPEAYNTRVEFALSRMKIETWPYTSKIAVAISSIRSLVIDQWIPQGIYDSEAESYTSLSNNFDIDTYKIIRSFLRTTRPEIRRIDADFLNGIS